MQYTTHYNLNLPEGPDIVNPLVQDNPNYSAIDSVLYANKLRVIGTATELTTGTTHALTRADQDIATFKFVATSDFHAGDTFTVDGITVTARLSSGVSLPEGSYKINSTVVCELNGTLLNVLNVFAYTDASHCMMNDGVTSAEEAINNKCKVVNGTITNDYGGYGNITKVDYPTGFDKDNTMVISSYMSADSGNSWYPINTVDGNYVYLEAGGILIYNTNGQFTGRIYRIALSHF